MPKALVAMSGGVDSAASAILMKQNGFDVLSSSILRILLFLHILPGMHYKNAPGIFIRDNKKSKAKP